MSRAPRRGSGNWWLDCDICIPLPDGTKRQHYVGYRPTRNPKHVTKNPPAKEPAMTDAQWRDFLASVGLTETKGA